MHLRHLIESWQHEDDCLPGQGPDAAEARRRRVLADKLGTGDSGPFGGCHPDVARRIPTGAGAERAEGRASGQRALGSGQRAALRVAAWRGPGRGRRSPEEAPKHRFAAGEKPARGRRAGEPVARARADTAGDAREGCSSRPPCAVWPVTDGRGTNRRALLAPAGGRDAAPPPEPQEPGDNGDFRTPAGAEDTPARSTGQAVAPAVPVRPAARGLPAVPEQAALRRRKGGQREHFEDTSALMPRNRPDAFPPLREPARRLPPPSGNRPDAFPPSGNRPDAFPPLREPEPSAVAHVLRSVSPVAAAACGNPGHPPTRPEASVGSSWLGRL
ncbi:atherin-like [Canis lupus familiaris]|uniref:atherin-like n=1 Tax=Canis lupus familiaris TaxID=9615 RepID=UPI0018F7E0AB|nr:atherin-like [Canis lupus familiaris]